MYNQRKNNPGGTPFGDADLRGVSLDFCLIIYLFISSSTGGALSRSVEEKIPVNFFIVFGVKMEVTKAVDQGACGKIEKARR